LRRVTDIEVLSRKAGPGRTARMPARGLAARGRAFTTICFCVASYLFPLAASPYARWLPRLPPPHAVLPGKATGREGG